MNASVWEPARNEQQERHALNARVLNAHLGRIRVLLERRIRWIRHNWREDPLAANREHVLSDATLDRLFATANVAAESDFYATDAIAATLTERAQSLLAQAATCEAQGASFGGSTVVRLQSRLSLSNIERDVLLLAVAPHLEPAFGSWIAYAQDDPSRARPTAALAARLFDIDAAHVARLVMSAGAPLRAWKLLHLDTAGGLVADDRACAFLAGDIAPDANIYRACRAVPSCLTISSHQSLADRITNVGREAVIELTGSVDSGVRSVAYAVARRRGLTLWEVDIAAIEDAGALAREAALSQAALFCRCASRSDLARIVPRSEDIARAPLLIVATDTPIAWPGVIICTVVRPDRNEQRALWSQALVAVPGVAPIDTAILSTQFDLGPEAIEGAVRLVRDNARLRTPPAPISTADIAQVCRNGSQGALTELAERLEPAFDWSDLVLPRDTTAQLRELAAQVRTRALVYEQWGFGAQLPRGRGISALFAGPSGTGKTMAAEVLARELSLPLFRVDVASTVSKYIGETPKHLKRIFQAAQASGALLFFDEADALFSRRTEVRDSHDRYANLEVNYLLQRMEEYSGVAILATNRKADFDRAFLRRLRFLIDFPLPDGTSRRRLWQHAFPRGVRTHDIDFEALGRIELTGASIRSIALNAAFLAAAAGGDITMAQVMHAVRRELTKIERQGGLDSITRERA